MTRKEELIEQLKELTKREVRINEEKTQVNLRDFAKLQEETDTVHHKF